MIQKSLAAKIGGGLAVAAGSGTGVYFANDYLSNTISKYDRALINYLNRNEESDIQFEVKIGDNENPTDNISDSSFTFSSSSNPKIVVVKVTASTSSESFKKKGNNDEGGRKEIKKENGGNDESEGTDWTWKCIIKLTSDSTETNSEIAEKDKLFKEEGKGLFGILKKDYSNDTTNRRNAKKVKTKFVRDCGKLRDKEKNRSLSESSSIPDGGSEVSSSIEFALTKKTNSGSGNNKLVPKKEIESQFNHWFKKSYKTGVDSTEA